MHELAVQGPVLHLYQLIRLSDRGYYMHSFPVHQQGLDQCAVGLLRHHLARLLALTHVSRIATLAFDLG